MVPIHILTMGNEPGKNVSDEERAREITRMDAEIARTLSRGVDCNCT